jgi:hypothetical protein
VFLTKPLDNCWCGDLELGGYFIEAFQISNQPVVTNWFLCCKKGSKLMAKWCKEFIDGLEQNDQNDPDLNRKQYVTKLKQNNVNLQMLHWIMPEYLSMHCSFLKISETYYDWSKVKLKCAGELNTACSDGPLSYKRDSIIPLMSSSSVLRHFLNDHKYSDIPVIKFTKPERLYFAKVNISKEAKPNSTFGALLY